MERYRIQVKKAFEGKRLDLAIVASDRGLSRRKARRIIDLGGAYLNKKRIRIASRTVAAGDIIELEYDRSSDPLVNSKSLELAQKDILFDQDGIVVVNKPPGVASQATRKQSVFHMLALVEKFFKDRVKSKGAWQLTHRLDKETSGAMIFALGAKKMQMITDQFRDRSIHKTYHALVWGCDLPSEFEVSCRLSSIQPGSGEVKVLKSGGKDSFTRFKLLEKFESHGISLVECYPTTGRSHQLRVHLASKSWPIVGDKVYGAGLNTAGPDIASFVSQHQMLHAQAIEFAIEASNYRLEAPYSEAMQGLIEALRVSRP